ncbi:MAG: S8 family serine peptidase [Jatrophihabitans sp.]
MTRFALPVAGLVAALVAVLAVSPAATRPETSSVAAVRSCAAPVRSAAMCLSQRLSAAGASTPRGLGARDIRSAYALSMTAGGGRTVAVVVAYDDPTAASDLAVYRKTYGLPPCTTANGCFRKVNQAGRSTMPRVDAGWAGESSLDIEMVSAACAACRILLVEASTASMADLAAAVDYAATQRVSAISNSYGSTDSTHAAAYDHPGIAVVAAAGDSSYGSGWPASYSSVIAVGGTTLVRAANARGWSETAWKGTGSACAMGSRKPTWQSSATRCAGKAVTDVSAVADPATGVAAYVATPYGGVKGWQVFGGTSAAAPLIAGVYAMSGRTAGYPASYTWGHRTGLNDITRGTNGSCSTRLWCNAATGWDGPTGLGTPRGTASF